MQERIILLRQQPEWEERAAAWFHEKWGVPLKAYRESMDACIRNAQRAGQDGGAPQPWPQWYLALDDAGGIAGGLGVIGNDFHDRPDLAPNVCAVYVEPAHRCRGLAGRLLDTACRDLRGMGVDTLYLLTDHTSFYERYGWEFYCMAQGDGEARPSRLYRRRME